MTPATEFYTYLVALAAAAVIAMPLILAAQTIALRLLALLPRGRR